MGGGERVFAACVAVSLAAAWLLLGTPDASDASRSGTQDAQQSARAVSRTAAAPGTRASGATEAEPGQPTEVRAAAIAGSAGPAWEALAARRPGRAATAPGDPEPTQAPADEGYTNEPYQRAGHYFDPRDLAVLRDIIELNELSEDSAAHDYDDGDGVLDPLDFGFQVWREGRLRELYAGPDDYFSFDYRLEELPESIGNLSQLRKLSLHTNRLRRLPETIGSLEHLEELRLDRNDLVELPEAIYALRGMRELNLSWNDLTVLPAELGYLESLETLYLRNNPLIELPEALGNLSELRFLGIDHTLYDDSNVRLAELPPSLADLDGVELQVGGNELYCGSQPPAFLTEGRLGKVYGLEVQACDF